MSYSFLPPISLNLPSTPVYDFLTSFSSYSSSSDALASPKTYFTFLAYLCQASEERNMPIILRILDTLYPKLIPPNNIIQHPNPSPLLYACRGNAPDVVRFYLAFGAPVDLSDGYPLRIASWNGFTEVCRILIQYGANVSVNNYEPLLGALMSNVWECVEVILQARADPNSRKGDLMELCLQKGWLQGLKLLIDYGGKVTERLILSGLRSRYPSIRDFFKNLAQTYRFPKARKYATMPPYLSEGKEI